MLKPHLLFSKLKIIPKVHIGYFVELNFSGMWNNDVLQNYMTNIIMNIGQTYFRRQPVLLHCNNKNFVFFDRIVYCVY